MVEAYFAEGRWGDYVDSLTEIYRARRDTMLDALAEFLPPEADWTRPSGGLFIWVTLPDYIDTTDLLARALRENVAFVPGEGAYLDGRGRSSMRLNFSGVDEDAIREGAADREGGRPAGGSVRDAHRALLRRRAAASPSTRPRGALPTAGSRRRPNATRRRTSGGRRSTSFHAVLRVVREPSRGV